MKISLDINGLAETQEELLQEIPELVRRVTFGIESAGKVAIQTSPSSGTIYPRGSGFHQASAPGEAPATDTGFLVNSIQAGLDSDVVGSIEVGANYGSILEDHNRPFMTTAIEKTLDQYF